MNQFEWHHHNQSSFSRPDVPYSRHLLSQTSPGQSHRQPPVGGHVTQPRKLPAISLQSMTDVGGPNMSQHTLPFKNIGKGDTSIRDSMSIGGMGLGYPRSSDQDLNAYDRFDPHAGQSSPRKRQNHPKSQASWHSEGLEKEMNPDPIPFISSEFKPPPLERVRVNGKPLPGLETHRPPEPEQNTARSSTVIKKVGLNQRHTDMWGSGSELNKTKGVAFHTERYGVEDIQRRSPDFSPNLGQPHPRISPANTVRAETNIEFMTRMRNRRKAQAAQNREALNWVMGGQQIALFERSDVQDELRKLKSIVLPTKAKDLYVGRGFKMPEAHAINKPRPPRYNVVNTPEHVKKQNGAKPDYYTNRTVKVDGGWSKTELENYANSDDISDSITDEEDKEEPHRRENTPNSQHKTPTPEPSGNAVIISREDTLEMGTDPMPKPASTKSASPNPLKGGVVESFVESSEFDKLRKTFKRLDTDMDGHLQFVQLKSQLPKGLTHAQERYIKVVYDLTEKNTFFGLNEYICMSIMTTRITSLQGAAKEAFLKVNFATIPTSLKQYVELFDSVDRANTGKISVESLRQLLGTALETSISESFFKGMLQQIQISGEINKMDFLAFVPYFLSLESLAVQST